MTPIDPALLAHLDEVPADARILLDDAHRVTALVRERTRREAEELRLKAAQECQAIQAKAEQAVDALELAATRDLTPVVRGLVDGLRALQTRYASAGQLDEALAIRAQLRQIRADLLGVRPDPGNLTEFSTSDVGRSFLYEVTGQTDSVIWGTEVYTADSSLSVAAVHAGLVRAHERALVRVTLVDHADNPFVGGERYGVQSNDYFHNSLAYRVEAV